MHPSVALCIVTSGDHFSASHPESPRRFQYLDQVHRLPIAGHFLELESPAASTKIVARVHSQRYLEALDSACRRAPTFLDAGDTYVTQGSFLAALHAAGGAVGVIEAVAEGDADSGFALIRPPGHHATATQAGGFCLLNNIAIAVRHAQAHGMQKAMIVDFDVHHGNGTQAIFAADPDVLYISTHQWGIYPGTGEPGDIGVGAGEGSIVNVPLPAGSGDQALLAVSEAIIGPVADRFRPDILLVSAGFDAHWRDPLASLQMTIDGYHKLAKLLVALAQAHCGGKLAFLLEGGYDPQVLVLGVERVLYALCSEGPPPDPIGPAPRPEPEIQDLLAQIRSIHSL